MDIPVKNKRVLCVTSNFPRWEGDSTTPFVLHLAEDLQALGWNVDVLAPHTASAVSKEVLGGVKVDRFRYLWPASLETVCYQGGALINLQQNRLNYIKLPALVFFEWLAIVKRLREERYDLLHSHWMLPQGFTGVLASRLFKIPHVITVHGSDAFGLQGKVLSAFKRFSLSGADAVTVNSSATKKQVLTIAPQIPEPRLIPMGVSTIEPDQQRAVDLRSKYREGNGPLLVFVGRLVYEKGVDDLIYAIANIKNHLPNVRALIIGEGQIRSDLEKLANNLEIADRVVFVGWVEPSDVPNYLAAADIFVGPSKQSPDGRVEAQGLTFLEAMAAGTVVIATAIGGITDSVTHEKTGLLVPANSPEAIAESILRLENDSALKESLAAQAKKVVNQFSRKASAFKFSELFKEQIEKDKPSSQDQDV
jgi:glycosyltransferase involved in cell wall biosynthesis